MSEVAAYKYRNCAPDNFFNVIFSVCVCVCVRVCVYFLGRVLLVQKKYSKKTRR